MILSIFQQVSELALVGKAPGHEEVLKRADSLDSLGDSVCSDSEEELKWALSLLYSTHSNTRVDSYVLL